MTTTTRTLSASFAGCLFAALACWLVRAESLSYRESLRQARAGAVAEVAAPIDRRASAEPPVIQAPIVAAPPEAPRPATVVAAAEKPAKPTVIEPVLSARPATLNGIAPVPSAAPAAPTPKPKSPGAIWADSLDLSRLSRDQEDRLGAELHALVIASNPVDRGGDLRRLKQVAAPLLATVDRKDVEYKFFVLDSDEVEALSLPGGYIYVTKGLFQLVGAATEPEQDFVLQFALGHEIAHVDLKHAVSLVAPGCAAARNRGIDTLTQLLTPIGFGYPDAKEFEADAWAYRRMKTRLERTHRESLMFLIRFQGFSERNGFPNGRELPDLKSGLTLIENHYRAHPAAYDRLDRLKGLAGGR